MAACPPTTPFVWKLFFLLPFRPDDARGFATRTCSVPAPEIPIVITRLPNRCVLRALAERTAERMPRTMMLFSRPDGSQPCSALTSRPIGPGGEEVYHTSSPRQLAHRPTCGLWTAPPQSEHPKGTPDAPRPGMPLWVCANSVHMVSVLRRPLQTSRSLRVVCEEVTL